MQVCIDVIEGGQVGEARRAAIKMAQSLGFDEAKAGKVAIVATELANNLARYGKQGRLLLNQVREGEHAEVEMVSIDCGPGMDLQRSLRDGYSTGGTPGTGLGAVTRLSSEFDAYSSEAGSVLMSRIGARSVASRPAVSGLRWGGVSLNAPHEQVCGDSWRVAEGPDSLAVMMADGLGHGPLANDAANLANRAFDSAPFDPPATTIRRSHGLLSGSRGAALALALVSITGVRYAGVGNIAGTLVSPEKSSGLMSQNGTVGVQLRKVTELNYEWNQRTLLVMHSDGINSRWAIEKFPGLAQRHPSVIAGVLLRDFLRGRDDATVLVVSNHPVQPIHA